MTANKGLIIGGLVLVLVVVGYMFFGSGAETGGKFVSIADAGREAGGAVRTELSPLGLQCAIFFPIGSLHFDTYLQLSDCPNGHSDCSPGEQCEGFLEAVCSISTNEAQCNLNMHCEWATGGCGLANPSNTGAPYCFTQTSKQKARVYDYEKIRFDYCHLFLQHADPDEDGYPMGNLVTAGTPYPWQSDWEANFGEDEIDPAWNNGGWDCAGENSEIYPGAEDVCDGLDNDCNGVVDDDPQAVATTLYLDGDSDGYGNASQSKIFMIGQKRCADTTGYVTDTTDCNDNSASAYPGATEVCDNIDNNCDGDVDEGIFDGLNKTQWEEMLGSGFCP